MGKRIFYLLLLIVSLVACSSQTDKPLRVGTIPWAGYEKLYLARDLGYYDNAQIQLKELASSTEVLHAFRQGQLDAIAVTLDEALRMAETHSDLKIVLIFNISNGADKLIVEPGITSLAELKNKRIAVEQSGVGAYMLSQVLRVAQLQSNEVIIVPSTINQHFLMLSNHQVEAVISFDPVAYQLQQQGYINLLDSSQLPGEIVDVLLTRDSAVHQQRKSIQQLLNGYWQARQYMTDNQQDALTRMAPRLGVSNEELDHFYQNLILPEREHQQYIFSHQLENIIESMSGLMTEAGLLNNAVDSQQLLYESMD